MSLITFDFDETLTQPLWIKRCSYFEPSSSPNHEAIALLKDFHSSGYEVRIVTTRWRPEGIDEFVEQYQLPVVEIHCTQGELKAKTLKQLGSQLHFDDSEAEAIANSKLGILTVIVSFTFDADENFALCHFKNFGQQARTDLESFIINHDVCSKILDHQITLAQVDSATKGKYQALSTKLKLEYNLGVVVRLRGSTGLTELHLSEVSENKQLSAHQMEFRRTLNIKKTINLVFKNFSEGVYPTKSEITDSIIKAVCKSN